MAKPKFDFTDKHNILRIEEWARDGATDKQIAENIGYSEPYFCELKGKIPELSEALTRGRAPLDCIVETNLYKRTAGMTVSEQRAFKVKKEYYDDEGRKCSEEEVVVVPVDRFIPPDVNAQIFWLRNRKPMQWNIEAKRDINVTQLSEEQVDHIAKELLNSIDHENQNSD